MLEVTAGKRRMLRTGTALATVMLGMMHCGALAQGLPDGGVVVAAGSATIAYDVTDAFDSSTVTVDIVDPSAIIDWNSFDVLDGKTAAFTSAETVFDRAILNRVAVAGGESLITGAITSQSNIAVWLVNPSGITFGSTGTFSGGSLVLSTLPVTSAFDGGSESLAGASASPIRVEAGASLSTNNPAGKILLLAQVINTAGTLSGGGAGAGTGATALVAASQANVTVAPSSPLAIRVVQGTTIPEAKVIAGGTIEGSSVYLVAASQSAVIDQLLDVNANITATADGGGVYLMTAQDPAVDEVKFTPSPTLDDGIAVLGGSIGATGAGGEVFIKSAGGLHLAGDITTGSPSVVGGNVTIKAVDNITLDTPGLIDAEGAVAITGDADVRVFGKIAADKNLAITSGNDVRITHYDPVADTGVLLSRNGNVTIAAARSVYGVGGSETTLFGLSGEIFARGYRDVVAGRDLTVNSAGHVLVNSLTAGRNLKLDIAGGLAGHTDTSAPTPLGGAIFALGGGGPGTGKVTVTAGPISPNVINLSLIDAAGTVALTADKVAVGELRSPQNESIVAGEYYVGRRSYPLDGTLNIPDSGVTLTNYIADETAGVFFPGYGRTNLSAGSVAYPTGAILPSSVGYGAQLGNVLAEGGITLTANGITANRVDSTTASINLTAGLGTLHVDTAEAADGVFLDKNLGVPAVDGDELRVRSVSAGAGVSLTSDTHVRIGGIAPPPGTAAATVGGVTTATGTILVTAATGDVSGLRGPSGSYTALPLVSSQPLTDPAAANGLAAADRFDALSDVYGKGNLTATTGDVIVTATSGGVQLGNLVAGRDITIDAGALTVDTAMAGRDLALSVNTGTLHLGIGSAGRFIDLVKGFDVAGQDDELLAWLLNAGTGAAFVTGGIEITSASDVRIGSAGDLPAAPGGAFAARGDIDVIANGDISGFRISGLATAPLDTDFVTTGDRFNALYGVADLTSALGSIDVLSNNGAAQLGQVELLLDVTGNAGGITIDDLTAGRDSTLTATQGTLYLGTGTVGRTTLLTKLGGSTGVDGDDLRVRTLTGGTATAPGGITLDSNTSVRADTVTAQRGSLRVLARNGDVSGFLTGAFERLPTISTGTVLSANYDTADLAATLGSVDVDGAFGGVQLGTVSAGLDVTVDARALTIGTLVAGRDALLTATEGTLYLGTGTVGRTSVLTKLGAFAETDGDDLRVGTLTGGTIPGPGGITLDSYTSVRAETVTAQRGNLRVYARNGDVSGLRTGSFGSLPTIATGTVLSSNYDTADLAAAQGTVDIDAPFGGVQIGTVTAGLDVLVDAEAMTIGTLIAGRDGLLTAALGTLYLGTGTVGRTTYLTKQGGSAATDGDDLRIATLTGGTTTDPGGIILDSFTSIRAGTVTAQRGNVSVLARNGDVSGFRTGTFERLPTVSPQPLGAGLDASDRFDALSDNYAKANFAATLGSVGIDAPLGGIQVGTATAAGDIAVDGYALTVDTANAGGNVLMTATLGTLHVGTAIADLTVDLDKQSGLTTVAGDELRAWSVTAGIGAELTSSTHVRVGSASDLPAAPGGITAITGDVRIRATAGDVSGFQVGGAFGRLPTVTTGTLLSGTYGTADLSATAGSVGIDALFGGAQLGTVTAGLDVTVDAQALTIATLVAGRDARLTSTLGTLYLGSGTVGRTTVLTKQGGSAATDGDDLRVATLTGGTAPGAGGITLDSFTSVRAGTVTAQRGDLRIIAASGDVSGFRTGAFERLPTVSTATVLSGNYGLPTLTSVLGTVDVDAANGGVQIGSVTAGLDVTVDARAMAIGTLDAGRDAFLTATVGTLYFGDGEVGRTSVLTKQGGPAAVDGDDLRVAALVGGTTTAPGGITLDSFTSVRAGTVTAERGNLTVLARNGDVSGLRTGTFERLATVTTGTVLSGRYDVADLTSLLGSVDVDAANGGVQLGTVAAEVDVTVDAQALTIVALDAGRDASLTATLGTLYLGDGTVGRTSVLTKQGGSAATDGDDLRVALLTGGTTAAPGGITLDSFTSVRAGTITAERGNLAVLARNGDVSGLRTGTFERLPTVTAGTVLSSQYDAADLESTQGSVDVDAPLGGAQLGTVIAGLDVTVDAQALSIATLDAGRDALLTATLGTLYLGDGTVGRTSVLTKQGGSAATDGDDLRVATLVGGTSAGPGGITLDSSTSVRAGTVTAQRGDLTVAAAGGDVSGLRTGAFERLPTVSTGSVLSGNYAAADLTSELGSVDVDAANGGVQLRTVAADVDVTVDARALAIETLVAGRDALLTATVGTLYLGDGTVGRTSVLTKQGGSAATNGDDLRVAALTGGMTTAPGGIRLGSSTSVRAGSVTALRGDLTVLAGNGDVSGLLEGTFERLPTVSTGSRLSANFGVANLESTLGNVLVQAANGGMQLGSVGAAMDIVGIAQAISLDNLADDAADDSRATADARAGRDLSLNASLGTLHLSSGAAGRAASLVKSGGAIGTLGDELRVGNLWAAAPNPALAPPLNATSVQLYSETHVRADQVVADTGNIAVTATAGDASGRLTGTATPSHLDPDFVTTGTRFNDQYGVAGLQATAGSVAVQAVAGEAQLGRVAAGTDVSVVAKGITLDDLDPATTDLTASRDATLTATAGTLYIGTASIGRTTVLTKQGGSATVPGDELRVTTLAGGTTTAPGGVLLDSSTGVQATTVNAQRGDLTIKAASGPIGGQAASAAGAVAMTASGDIAYGTVSSGSATALSAGRDIAVGTLTAGSSIGATAGRSVVVGTATAGTTLALNATGGTLSLNRGTATGDVTLASLGKATLGTAGMSGDAVATSGTSISLTASDASIHGGVTTGGQTSSRITVIDRSTGANLLRLGTTSQSGTTISTSTQDVAGSFTLTQDEINRFSAATLVLDAGTMAGSPQDVLIGALTLGAPLTTRLSSLQLNAQQRIDVVGTFTWAASATSTLRLGGTAANVNDRASVLRVAANAAGTAGRIDAGLGALELRAAQIGIGQDTGFLTLLGVTPGSSPSATFTPSLMVGNSGSPLYSASAQGGAIYALNGPPLISAGTLTVRYTDFALFQNTGILGINRGVTLASTSSPSNPALQLFGPNPPDAGPFALFGTINGIPDVGTAVLPVNTGDANSVINLLAIDRTTARINGCLVGSTAGCVGPPPPPPSLDSISQSRATILLPDTTFELPFDPLIGTNNDSLFGDVGTFGLGDIPIAPLECDKDDETGCAPVKEEGTP